MYIRNSGGVCPVKIGIPTILIHLWVRSVDAKCRAVPDVWDVVMDVPAPVMPGSSLWAAASQTIKASVLLNGKGGRIGTLPFPASLWTGVCNLPVAPSETFRQWWKRTHPEGETPLSQVAGTQSGRDRAGGFPADPPPPSGKPVSGSASTDDKPTPTTLDARSAISNPKPIAPEASATQIPTSSASEREL